MTPNHPAADVPFTLVCLHCDAGMDIDSHEQAIAEGWTDIDYAPDLPMANYVGQCPDCREAFDRWPATDGGNT
jgi:hypothetical protein